MNHVGSLVDFHRIDSCPWCGSPDVRHLARRADGLDVDRCDNCSLGFLADLPDDVSVFYDEQYFTRSPILGVEPAWAGYEDYERSYSPSSFRWLTSLIRAASGGRRRLFDLGAATGTFLEMARMAGFEVSGSELTAEGAEAAQARGLDVKQGHFDPNDWEPGSFDVVTALEVLEHVTDLRAILHGLDRLLTDDGLLVFFVPNLTSDIVDEYGDNALDFNKSFDHTLYFNPESLGHIFGEVFGPGSLTLFTADVEQWGQHVSSAIGFVRKRRDQAAPEVRLFGAVDGEHRIDDVMDADDAIAIALTAAKFFRDDTADAAMERAQHLGASPLDVAMTRAQVLRNRGEILNAIEILEGASVTAGADALTPNLILELVKDLLTVVGIEERGMASGLRELHRQLDERRTIRQVLERFDVAEQQLGGRARAAEERAARADAEVDRLRGDSDFVRAELDRARADIARLRDVNERLLERLADADAERAASDARATELEASNARLVGTLNEIYDSRAWRLATSAWKLRRGFRRTAVDQPVSQQAPAAFAGRAPAPTVSVIMPVYNKGATLRSSLDSVLAQTYPHVEVIIWDDGSTDPHTLAELSSIDQDEGVRVIHARNSGVIRARNSAMRLATGDLLVCVDPDDRLGPTYLEKAVTYLESHSDVSIVYPWQQTVGDRTERWETQDLDSTRIAESNHVPVCAVFRREVFDETGGFSPQMSDGFEDWEFWTHAAELGFRGRVIPEPLFEYEYRHDAAESRDAAARQRLEDLTRRIQDLHPRITSPRVRTHRGARPSRLSSFTPQLPAGTGRPVVLFLPWFTVGGADRVVESLARHWSSSGRTVVVVTTLGVGPGMDDRFPDLLSITPFGYQLTNLLPERYWYDAVARLLSALPPATVVNVGSSWLHEHAERIKVDFPEARIIDQQFNDAGHIVGNSRAAASIDHTITAYHGLEGTFLTDGRDPATVSTIYVGIEPVDVDDARIAESRAELGLDPDEPYVVFVGRLAEEKRPDWLLSVADALEPRGVGVVAVGTGPMADDLAPEFDRRANLTWVPYVAEVAPLLRGARVSLIPSRIEGIPLAAMESLAVGTPVVATAVGGLPELEEVQGMYIVDPDDVHEFVAAVERVATSGSDDAIILPPDLTTAGMLRHYDELIDPAV